VDHRPSSPASFLATGALVALGAFVLFAGAGCGSGQPKFTFRQKPGEFFRFFNATGRDLPIYVNDLRVQEPHTPAGGYCSFRKESAKAHRIKVGDGAGSLQQTLTFTPGALTTYIVTEAKGKLQIKNVAGELRDIPSDGSQVRLLHTDLPRPFKVALVSSKEQLQLGAATGTGGGERVPLEPGDYQVKLSTGEVLTSVKLEEQVGYSLMVYRSGGKTRAALLRNSPEPMQAARAAVSQN
jgi:hypothetical protein